ncbi:protein kinase [Nocardiopsis dassonvillei]|uniref:methylation-associated defense system protein kinase MAD6 n=1 Tax=Nocardiopsis dassonvillei TaxID=2014 RepID=UPI0008FC9D98|nr:serine/threonine protein kinase [Nocardiopsis dassonvillei]APC34353.1 protein kinase [Nocardiopsis dassonvillei]
MGARIVAVGEPVNDAERSVIAHLRDHGHDDWTVLHSIEIPQRGGLFEVDLIVVTGHAVYVIDVKGTRGLIVADGGRWHPEGRSPFRSPLPKLRGHAKKLKSLLEDDDARLSRVYTHALVVLPGRDAVLEDRTPNRLDAADTVTLTDLVTRLSDAARIPVAGRPVDADISAHHTAIVDLVKGSARAPSGPLRFGNWQVIERLSESQRAPGVDVLDEYRAKNASAVQGSGTVRLSVRAADPYASDAERQKQQRQIGIAYEALGKLPAHPHIVGVRDFFPWNDESAFVTVYDDVPGHALRLHLSGAAEPLSADAKLRTIRHILLGLAHAHRRRIAHRELSPSTVLITHDGRAMLTGFDYAKTAQRRAHTVAQQAHAAAEAAYLAPECHADPSKMGTAADIYAVGVIGFELLTGRLPFASATAQVRANGRLSETELRDAGVRVELAHWLQTLCEADPARRPVPTEALRRLDLAVGAARAPRKRLGTADPRREKVPEADTPGPRDLAFFKDLPEDFQLGTKYLVKRRLGRPGSFGVAYRVYDSILNVELAVKLVLHDQDSTLERLRREASVLKRLADAPHPNVVTMVSADRLPQPDNHPYLVFEFVDGKDVGEVIRSGRLGPADVLKLGIDTARGLDHIHKLGVWHCDIKPSNLLWTDGGVKLLDFGIAKTADTSQGHTHTSPPYTPPDLDEVPANGSGFADRDLYALGITMYEALTGGQYPWQGTRQPPPGERAPDPRRVFSGLGDLAPGLVEVLLKAIAPYRAERYTCAEELLGDLSRLDTARVPTQRMTQPDQGTGSATGGPPDEPPSGAASAEVPPNTNPYVAHLQTLYSQSRRSNRGTRGLDPHAMMVYVETALDRALVPALREGKHALVVITGNAGDGKTAFLEHFERKARDLGAEFGPARPNGSDFTLQGRGFRTNHDGSQDEGDAAGDDVLEDFFSPYAGNDEAAWTDSGETRMIAVNEGRLVDFLSHRKERFPRLTQLVKTGLAGGTTPDALAVVNLNTRDVTARPTGPDGVPMDGESILERMVGRMASDQFWEACASCDLAASCYARHNALTLGHPDAGPQVTRRLRRIYELTQLRGQLHITLRDLRSALAYTLTSGRDCKEIHQLYAESDPQPILDSYYFSAHLGAPDGRPPERDRLLRLLRETDVAAAPQPQLDRRLDYTGLLDDRALVAFDGRPDYDRKLLEARFEQLGRSTSARPEEIAAHRRHLNAARRLLYFELYDDERAQRMLPHPSALRFLELLASPATSAEALEELLHALNRGEGLAVPDRVENALALQMRDVPGGTVRSFRLFPAAGFTLEPEAAPASSYVEGSRAALLLRYRDPEGRRSVRAELRIGLDLFELLQRFAKGYRPGIADMQGRQLALSVFKNTLASVPYQEVVLTAHGRDLHRIRRTPDHVLHMEDLTARPAAEAQEETWH